MKKAMISIPMGGRQWEDVVNKYNEIKQILEKDDYEVVNTLFNFDDIGLASCGITHIPLYYLAKSIEELSRCDLLYLCKGWEQARGCRIERNAAALYDVEIKYE